MSQPKTPVMVLQELTVKLNMSTPEYDLAYNRCGTHDNEFRFLLKVAGITTQGIGRSKQVAKHDAASKALEILAQQGIYDPNKDPQEFKAQSHRNESGSPLKPSVNFIGTLHDLCLEFKLPPPDFKEISDVGPPHAREFTYECKIASITTQKTANTKKQAKQLAARDMLEKVKDICPQLVEEMQAQNNALTETDQRASSTYQELVGNASNVIPNRSIEIENITTTLRKIMLEKNLTIDDFDEEFKKKDMDSLKSIFERLEVTFNIVKLQDAPCLTMIDLHIETPFTFVACGEDETDAEQNLLESTFKVLKCYMTINLDDHSCI